MPRKVTYEVTILGTDGGISVYYLETDWETDWQTDWEIDWGLGKKLANRLVSK